MAMRKPASTSFSVKSVNHLSCLSNEKGPGDGAFFIEHVDTGYQAQMNWFSRLEVPVFSELGSCVSIHLPKTLVLY